MEKIDFYKDKARGTINPKLFSGVAEQVASKVAQSGQKTGRDEQVRLESNRRTQIRKFFDEVTSLNATARSSPEDWDNIIPYVNMLIAKAAYAHGRNRLVTQEFVDMLKQCVQQIQEPKDLDVFANFFEAFMGFYRQYD